MKAFFDPVLLGKGRFYATCLTTSTEICGVKPSFLTVLDLQQNDDEGMPKLVYQQDTRLIPNLEAVKRQINNDIPGSIILKEEKVP